MDIRYQQSYHNGRFYVIDRKNGSIRDIIHTMHGADLRVTELNSDPTDWELPAERYANVSYRGRFHVVDTITADIIGDYGTEAGAARKISKLAA